MDWRETSKRITLFGKKKVFKAQVLSEFSKALKLSRSLSGKASESKWGDLMTEDHISF